MRRIGNLFADVCSFGNLLSAAKRARRGKKNRPDVLAFHMDLEANLLRLRDELGSGLYQPGAYRTFKITDPKPRVISAAPYRDRVVHHALCSVIEPVFERRFIYDSYANRKGKGSHAAIDRCTCLCRSNRTGYVLKCDVARYFPSIDHEILHGQIGRSIKCRETLNLIGVILNAAGDDTTVPTYFDGDNLFTPFERRIGVPIGNLTSQLIGNVYLNSFDHWMKETIQPAGYIRFVDDFLVFSESRSELFRVLGAIRDQMSLLRLSLHPRKCQVTPMRCGVEFLGWHVFPDHRRIRRSTGVRFQRKLKLLSLGYRSGNIGREEVHASVMSWIGHLKHGDTWGLRASLFEQWRFSRDRE